MYIQKYIISTSKYYSWKWYDLGQHRSKLILKLKAELIQRNKMSSVGGTQPWQKFWLQYMSMKDSCEKYCSVLWKCPGRD